MRGGRAALAAALLLAVLLAVPAAADSPAKAAYRVIPEALRFRQEQTIETLKHHRAVIRVYPATACPRADREIREIVDRLYENALPDFPGRSRSGTKMARLDVGPYISRVGSRWMSFLVIARVTDGQRQCHVDYDARVYEMDTGERIALADVIDGEKGGWTLLAREVRARLTAYFPDTTPDGDLLDMLCSEEELRRTAFTLTPGHLALHWRTDELYLGRSPSMMHADIPWSVLRPCMTERALRETDCTGYRLLALTYDDGPGGATTDGVINQLRLHGAGATFFLVGARAQWNTDLVNRAFDAGFSVQSHSWIHEYDPTPGEVAVWKENMDRLLSEVTGLPPAMFRSPGGNDVNYIRCGINMPLIHWSAFSGDAEPSKDAQKKAEHVFHRVITARPGSVVLLHDLNNGAVQYAAAYLPVLERNNFLLVTVQDLCELRGVELEPDVVYFGKPPQEDGDEPAPGEPEEQAEPAASEEPAD